MTSDDDSSRERPADAAGRQAEKAARQADEGEREPDDYGAPPSDDDALLAECDVETFRAGGPGGQHQNKTESAVRLVHRPTGVTVIARDSRSQHRNRKVALGRLREALDERARPETPRVETKVPTVEKRKRLESKRRRSRLKKLRKPPESEE